LYGSETAPPFSGRADAVNPNHCEQENALSLLRFSDQYDPRARCRMQRIRAKSTHKDSQGARIAPRNPGDANSMPLEILHRALVLLGPGTAGERAEIAPPAGLRILLARIQPVLPGRELPDH